MPVTNEDGWVAIKRYQTIPRMVTIGDDEYVFTCQHNICMSWIRPEHVDQVLAVTKMCCGGNRKPMFLYAQPLDVHRWQNGGR